MSQKEKNQMKNRTNFNRRVGIRLTDGQFYTLQNLANFHNMSVADFVKKSCNVDNIPAQTEFTPIGTTDNYELVDNTPDAVVRGDLTLKQYHDTNDAIKIEYMYEDLKEKVNMLFNSLYCNPDEDYTSEEDGRIYKGDAGLPEKADEVCYQDCVNTIAGKYKQFGVTSANLMNYIKNNMIPETGQEDVED